MRAINAYCITTLIIASLMTAVHYGVVWLLKRPVAEAAALLSPPDAIALTVMATPVEPPKFSAAAGTQWLMEARALAVKICIEKGEVTADDIWNAHRPPENVDGRLLGPVFAGKEWVKVRETRSERGNNNNRYIVVWKLRESEA